ncbi:hypothetical protein CSUI_008412 [Cystoisospora suis]|uniref:Uncharacterized protein n=1 Tax=Cystoisospora suis TaxID=483139 RepID=A0A2C6JNN1_9APIC|nr:hypothetical protein CSUI_008412 [Cystoisospora suis]
MKIRKTKKRKTMKMSRRTCEISSSLGVSGSFCSLHEELDSNRIKSTRVNEEYSRGGRFMFYSYLLISGVRTPLGLSYLSQVYIHIHTYRYKHSQIFLSIYLDLYRYIFIGIHP